mgnify:FL=1
MSKFYDMAYKWSLYEKHCNGFTLAELSEMSGVTDKSLSAWFKQIDLQYSQAGTMDLKTVHRRNAQLRNAFTQKHTELLLLQNEPTVKAIPEIARISCAQRVLLHYGPNQVCRTLRIRKSNLYYHAFRRPELTSYEKRDLELRPAIQKICETSHKRIGAERIRQQLIEQGFIVCKKKVLRLLREIDPRYTPLEKKNGSSFTWNRKCANLLNRKFSPPRPNMAWLGDITDIKTDAGTCCLCVILDLFSRRIVAAHLGTQKNADLVCHTFQNAFAARGAPKELLFHSDQGGQYTGRQFRNLLHNYGVTQSFSTPGVPYDNAPMESFFASLKVEEIHRYRYHGISDLAASLKEYLEFYNHKRPHSSIGNQTPAQAEEIYFKKQNAVSISTDCVPFVCKK